MLCEVPDEQTGRFIGGISLPEAWIDRVLARVQLAGKVKGIGSEDGSVATINRGLIWKSL